MRASEILKQTGRSIAYRPALAKLFGGVTAEIFFEQIFYWQDKAENQELGVYKTQAELEEETGLSRKEQETARKKLREIGVLIETHKRLEHRIYFKIDMEKLDEVLSTLADVQSEHSRMPESDIREVPKRTFVNTLDYNTRLHTN
ncbi:DNA replication protein, partial [Pasteurella multocida]|nr:DNA replication protein [Pasteurella multocida]